MFPLDSLAIKRTREACARQLADWYNKNARSLPWRSSNDPYAIWISECMLQQTRVEQALGYYNRFIVQFPTLQALADASVDEVLKAWEGLGYYSRARNLHKAANVAIKTYGGLPDSYVALLTLPGIGPYTAAALASIAYDKPCAVLDGNVIRVLARLFSIRDDVRESKTRSGFQSLATALLNKKAPGMHNQALMELGALVCTPKKPNCVACPLTLTCKSLSSGDVDTVPFKSPRPPIPHHDVVVGLLVDNKGNFLITKRPDDVMLGGLWEFPGGKRRTDENLEDALVRELNEELGIETKVLAPVFQTKHAYTHFRITLHAFECTITKGNPRTRNGMPMAWVSRSEMETFAFPRANRKLIESLTTDQLLLFAD